MATIKESLMGDHMLGFGGAVRCLLRVVDHYRSYAGILYGIEAHIFRNQASARPSAVVWVESPPSASTH